MRIDQRRTAGGLTGPDGPAGGDGPAARAPGGERGQWARRLLRLPRWHPSSPFRSGGTAGTPVSRPGDSKADRPRQGGPGADQPRPLTDAEHAEHVRDVAARLDKARRAGLTSERLHTIDPAHEVWSDERAALHSAILTDLYREAANVPCERRAIIAGGLGGSGKSTLLREHAGIDASRYLTIDPDRIKLLELARRGAVPRVAGLSPMEASDLVHEESSYVARRLALRAQADEKNLIWDITMSSPESASRRVAELRATGYSRVDGIFADIPLQVSLARADARYRRGHEEHLRGRGLGGRLIPAEVITRQADPDWGSANRRNFEEVKPLFDNWVRFDNSGAAPVLADAGGKPEEQ